MLLSAHGRVPASRIHNVHTLQQLSGLSAIHHFPETRRAFRRASTCERHGSHGQGGCTPSRAIVHECCTRDVPFLGALTCEKRYRRRLYLFLRPAGRRVFFGVARTITYVARKFPRSFDVLRLQGVKYSTCRYAQRFEWQVRVGLTAVSGIGGETRDTLLWIMHARSYSTRHN